MVQTEEMKDAWKIPRSIHWYKICLYDLTGEHRIWGRQMIVDKGIWWNMFDVSPREVSNFSPFGVMEIFFATAICGVPTYIIVSQLECILWSTRDGGMLFKKLGSKQEDHARVMSSLRKSSSGWSPRPRYRIHVFHVVLFRLEASIEIWPHSTDKARLYPDWNINVTQAGFRDFESTCGLWEWSGGPMWCQ